MSKSNVKRTYPRKKGSKVMHTVAKQEVRKALRKNIETKMYDGVIQDIESDWNGQAFSATANLAGGSVITQSVTDSGYVGNKIQPFMYQARIKIALSGTSGTSHNVVRILLVQVIGGGIPSPLNVLASVGNMRTPLSAYDRDYRNTYRVLYDKMVTLNYINEEAKAYKITVKRGISPISFVGTAGAVQQGGLYLVIYSDEDDIATAPTINCYHRLYYKDA